ncbi:Major facilitator superfamily domaingeneral substrate transporter [Penicillium daleae]|uniref:Major facilitator superfamily domaingeneral substrate transporter n=1 Tax=Penicillium daleae TaxID=63821 RepID=A0AAD6G5P6_9EURO|nr:Major facilitator superfamily domaingeneral substrate transporter [Penicillium daleae]KAJ5460296.1 Major facilitator superfamily domaingeneral substrate transporter [Penicillium daleae]
MVQRDEEKPEDVPRVAIRENYPVTDLGRGIVGWDDQSDPLNPSPFASSVFAPAAADADRTFDNTSSILGSLTVTSYLFGYGFGPLFLSPLSEMYGRRIILNISTSFFVLFQIGCALAPNLSALIVFRLLTGIGGSACLTIGGGVVSDLFEPEQRGMAMSIFGAGPLFGPVLGPICGGFIAQRAGWRWVFWVLVIAGGSFTLFVMIFNRETNPVILVRRKTVLLRKELGRSDLRSCYEKAGEGDAEKGKAKATHFLRSLSTPFQLLFRSPIVSIIAMYIATVYGCLYLLLTTITTAFKDTYNWSIESSGLAYLGLGIGFIFGQLVFGMLSDRVVIRLKAQNGDVFEPEMRLPLCIFFALFVPVSFFWYGWSLQAKAHWIVPIIGLFPFAFGLVGIFGTLQTYIIDSYPRYAASGIAAITVSRSLVGALLPLAGPTMYRALGYGWGNSLLGFITLAMLLMPIIFNRVGASLRKSVTLDLK